MKTVTFETSRGVEFNKHIPELSDMKGKYDTVPLTDQDIDEDRVGLAGSNPVQRSMCTCQIEQSITRSASIRITNFKIALLLLVIYQ
jgi:hypothetical protein